MARLVSCVGVVLLLLLKAHPRHRQQCVVFLGMTFLVTLIAADSPAAGDSRLHPAHRHAGFLGDFPSSTGSPPPPAASRNTAFQSPDSPVAPFVPNPAHEARTADGMPFRWQRIPPSPSEPFDPSRFLAEEPRPLSPAEPASGSSLQSEAAAQLPADRKRSAALSPTRTRTQQLPRSNASSTPFGPSSSQTRGNATSQAAPLPQPSDLDSPNWVPLYVLPNSDEVLVPGYNVPFIAPHPTSPSSEPTEVPPEDFYPTNTMEPDWGSGDYLETMSFLNSDGDDYSLVTKVPSDSYDPEDYTESYDTSFPSRVGISPSSSHPLHFATSPSFTTAYGGSIPLQSSVHSPNTDIPDVSDIDWPDAFTIQPTDVLLPDMNSLEYYTIQLTKENGSGVGAEHKGKVTIMSVATTTETTPTGSAATQGNQTEEESSSDLSGFDESAAAATTEANPQLVTVSEPVLDPSIVPSHFFDPSSSVWGGQVSTTMWSTPTPSLTLDSDALTEAISPHLTPLLPDDATSTSSSLTDVHWFVTESFLSSTADTAPVLTATAVFSAIPTQPVPDATAGPTEPTPQNSPSTTEQTLNTALVSTDPTSNVTTGPPAVLSDQGVTDDGEGDARATATSVPVSSEATVATSPLTTATTTTTTSQQPATTTTTTEATTGADVVPTTSVKTTTAATTARQYLCSVDRPVYLVKIAFPSGATVGYAKSQIRDILKAEFNKSVELQVVDGPPKFVFRAVSGPVVYTAISVINALRRSGRRFLSVSPSWTVPDSRYQVHTVLQFVPGHVDVRYCNFSESIERGLTMAFAEVRRRSKQSTNFTVQIVNITMAAPKHQEQRLARQPVDITFTARASLGYLTGSAVSDALMKLTTVEFSYYMGFPVLQIAEPFLYPELNTSQLLRSSWVRTVLLGVLDQKVGERTFQANMERRVAMLLGEAMALGRRVKRATAAGNNSVQIVSANRLVGADHPLEIIYFVEGPSGQRIAGVQTANLLNSLDVQRAAIVLGYRVQGILAQPVEKVMSSPSDSESTNMWIIIGVVIPLLVVIIIISILYWKLCRTDKLEFQPDAMTSIQQRQKSAASFRESRTSLHRAAPATKRDRQFREEEEYEEEEEAEFEEEEEGEEEEEEEEKEVKMLQAPSVKGFDFAKLHLGQQSKDDIMVIQESVPSGPGPLPMSVKDGLSPSENGEIPTPVSKTSASSTKASRTSRRRERISPSDVDSVVSDRSSEQESTEENLRAHATPSDSKQTRPPPVNGTSEQLSSAAIFEHVDRMSRAADASRRLPNKVQLIAMQPMPMPPLHRPPVNGKVSDTNQINKEIQVALRHKSEIEHHRNKIRLRAKRKGHYDFPAMDDVTGSLGDPKDQDRIYQKAQTQIDKILDPDTQMPSIFMESKKSGRGRRSPKQRMKEQLNGGMMEADKDHLITEDNDAAYRKCPGVNNVAYVSDPDQGPGSPHRSPSPTDDVFLGPTSSPPGHAPPPPPYMPPQPSIEEARQQMHSLLDDAFALVSPTSQGSTAGITLPGVNSNHSSSSPPGQGPRSWGPSYQGFSPFPNRFTELSMTSPSVQALTPRQGIGSSYLPPGETGGHGDQLQADSLFSSRGLYDELPSSARPRPVGGTTGAQLHHLTQVGLSSRLNSYPAGVRAPPGQNGGIGWNQYHDDFSRVEPEKDVFPDCPDYSSNSVFQMPRSVMREPSAPPAHLETPVVGYLSAPPPLDTSPPTHSSASLIKAIREELLRLSQKQAAMPSYHS